MDIFIGVFVTGGSAAFQLPAQFQLPRAGMGIGQLVQQQAGGLVPCRAVMQVGTGQRHVGHPARTAVADGGHHHILGHTQALAAAVLDGTDGDGIRGAEQRVDLPRPLEQLAGLLVAGLHVELGHTDALGAGH